VEQESRVWLEGLCTIGHSQTTLERFVGLYDISETAPGGKFTIKRDVPWEGDPGATFSWGCFVCVLCVVFGVLKLTLSRRGLRNKTAQRERTRHRLVTSESTRRYMHARVVYHHFGIVLCWLDLASTRVCVDLHLLLMLERPAATIVYNSI
jgi:hypothetical protein